MSYCVDISDDVEVESISGSADRGGWQCTLRTLMDTGLLAQNQRVIVTWRGVGDTPATLRTAFNGFVLPNQLSGSFTASQARLIAETTDGFLRRGWLQGLGLADLGGTARAHYHQWNIASERMTLGRVVRHILGFRDNLGAPPVPNPAWVAHTNHVYHAIDNPHGWINLDNVEVTPFDVIANPDGTMRLDRYTVRETKDLWATLEKIASDEFFYIYFDKQDRLYYTKHPMFLSVLPNPVMTFDRDFILEPLVIEPRDTKQVRQVRLHASTDDGDTMHAEYPIIPTHVYGRVEDGGPLGRLRCNDQDTLDDWAQRHYAWLNRDYTVRVSAAGLVGLLFEIWDRVQITYTGTINGLDIDWTDKKFWIRDITVVPKDPFTGLTTFTLEAEG